MTQPRNIMESMPNDELALLARITASNAGIITVAALRDAGISSNVTSRMVRRGLITREFRGIYRLGFQPPCELERWRLACAATAGCLSHGSAARYWGYLDLPAAEVHVTVRRRRRAPTAEWLLVHSTTAPPPTVSAAGLTVTNVLRTAIDLAGQLGNQDHLTGFVDHCIAKRLMTTARLERYVRSHGVHVEGVGLLRRLLLESADTDSRAEAELVRLLVGNGIARPATRYVIRRDGHFVARVDLAWPAGRLALELDGYCYHSDHGSFVQDRERGNRLVAAGWTLLRTTPSSMRQDPAGLCEAVRTALSRSRVPERRPAAAPPPRTTAASR